MDVIQGGDRGKNFVTTLLRKEAKKFRICGMSFIDDPEE
jgi:hypothetical protein